MATTTNYGWTTPDDTALVKDGASAIRTLGTSVDTTTKNLNPSTTLGDIEYRSSTANTNTRLAIGSTGQVLTVAGGVPSWASSSSTPRIGQVVTATSSSTTTTTSTSFVDATGFSVTITPTASNSKILILSSPVFQSWSGSAGTSAGGEWQLVRGATAITNDSFIWIALGSSPTNFIVNFPTSISYVDSPATTSATTYKVQFLRNSGATNVYANPGATPTQIIAMEILV